MPRVSGSSAQYSTQEYSRPESVLSPERGGASRSRRDPDADADTADDLAATIGEAIRARRLARELTMAQLADISSLSQPFLSKVERGLAQLSMGALDRVARALGTSAVGLLAGADTPVSIDVVRRADRIRLPAYDGDEGFGQALTRRSGQLRVVEFDSGPTEFNDKPYVHRNDTVCIVLEGIYEFELDDTRLILSEGDSVSSSGGVRQRYRVLEGPARLLLVLVSEDVDVIPRSDLGRADPSDSARRSEGRG